MAMAASALSLYTLSKPSKFLHFERGYSPFSNPVAKIELSSSRFFNSHSIILNSNNCIHIKDPIFIRSRCRNRRRAIFETSVSAQQDSEPQQTNDEDGAVSGNFKANLEPPSNLTSLIQVHREAILTNDPKILSDIEAVILTVEKEKNELVKRVSDMSAEISSGKERYLRLQADFDNHRKRSEKERLRLRSDVQGEVIESLLPMVDSFERAKQQMKLETEQEKKIDASYQGIYKQFVEIMRSLKVAAVPTVGKPFDPAVHEAIGREESLVFKEGIVMQELRRGFFLGDRLLRPATVKVSSGPGKKMPSPEEEKSTEQPASVAGASKDS